MTDFLSLADARFVSLTTFRRSGAPVSTPVYVARDGDELIVTTPAESGKVKRLRNDPRVTLRPCSRRGAVTEDAPVLSGVAHAAPPSDADRLASLFRRKYGLEYRFFLAVERLMAGRRRDRVLFRISPAPAHDTDRPGTASASRGPSPA